MLRLVLASELATDKCILIGNGYISTKWQNRIENYYVCCVPIKHTCINFVIDVNVLLNVYDQNMFTLEKKTI